MILGIDTFHLKLVILSKMSKNQRKHDIFEFCWFCLGWKWANCALHSFIIGSFCFIGRVVFSFVGRGFVAFGAFIHQLDICCCCMLQFFHLLAFIHVRHQIHFNFQFFWKTFHDVQLIRFLCSWRVLMAHFFKVYHIPITCGSAGVDVIS